jgi:hypothetical protein
MGGHGSAVRVLRHLAARHQYRDDHRHVSDGVLDPEFADRDPPRSRKLDELIRVGKARNSFVGVEHLTEEELEEIRTKCEGRAQQTTVRRNAPKSSNAPKNGKRRKSSLAETE